MRKYKTLDRLKEAVRSKNLKYTRQREMVFETIYQSKEHLSVEDIYNKIKKTYPDASIGIATVYKSVNFLEETNLITSLSLGKESKRYEANIKEHHDHLICTKCDSIVEFVDDVIEKKQTDIAHKYGFVLEDHTMYLYGQCPSCQK